MYIELWKWIPGWEGYYMVSTHGRIKSVDRYVNGKNGSKCLMKGKILKQGTDRDGYKKVVLYKNKKGKTYRVHRLVAMTFIPNSNNLSYVNHKDENPSNNTVWNLEWCTHKYNDNYGTRNERISKAHKGKPKTEEAKKRQSESMKGKYTGKNHPYATPILMFTKNNVFVKRFDCIVDANEYLGNNRHSTNIIQCAKGINKTAYGFKWKYEKDCK